MHDLIRENTVDTCGYIVCGAPAVFRGRTIVPNAPVARCYAHHGHHDFTERIIDGIWHPIRENSDPI